MGVGTRRSSRVARDGILPLNYSRAACVVVRRVGHADQDVDIVKRGTLIGIGWHAKPETRSGSRSPSSRSRVAQPTTTGQPSLSLRCERRD